MEFVKLRMNHMIIKKAQVRDEIDAYPERALFEGIVNACAHRDYYIDGSQIQIDMFRDRLEIVSPGSYFNGAAIKKTYDLASFSPKRRNKLISGVLVECRVMEAAGTGFEKIMKTYEGVDRAHSPFISSYSDHFRLTLPDLTYEEGVSADDEGEIELCAIDKCSAHDEKILRYCARQARKAGEIASYLGINDSSYFRKNIIGELYRKGYLVDVSSKNPRFYRTSDDIIYDGK